MQNDDINERKSKAWLFRGLKNPVFLILSFFHVFSISAQSGLTLDQALTTAVKNNYDIQKQRYAVAEAQAQYRQAKGAFDFELGAEENYALSQNPMDKNDPLSGWAATGNSFYIDNTTSKTAGGSVFVQKLFSFGLSSKLSYSVNRSLDIPHYTNTNLPGETDKWRNRGSLSLELSLPLFKSFTNSLSAMQLESANDYKEQMRYALEDYISKFLVDTSSLYFDYYLSYQNLQNLKKHHQILKERLDNMPRLISAGVRSKNDQLAMQVSLNETNRSIKDAEARYNQAKTKLAMAMGLSDFSELPNPSETLPVIDLNQTFPDSSQINDTYLNRIIQNKADFIILKKQLAIAERNLKMKKTDAMPDATFDLGMGTAGTAYSNDIRDYAASGFKNMRGANVKGTLGISFKLGDNQKNGAIEQAQAQYDSVLCDYNKAKSELGLKIRSVLQNLAVYKASVQEADEYLELNDSYYQNEIKRFNAGLITTDALLEHDERYISAKASHAQVLVQYLQTVLEFKYYTGDLVEVDAGSVFK
ncbi:MAG: TolC family protein [Spirochaetaceae bacterium]|nr:TolC family protein [Spirochaetaceae bacterium]